VKITTIIVLISLIFSGAAYARSKTNKAKPKTTTLYFYIPPNMPKESSLSFNLPPDYNGGGKISFMWDGSARVVLKTKDTKK
jgi:hypothetical protein